jgi:DNA-binding SARP family transcriptional activator
LLGPLEVLQAGREVPVGAGKRRALLALLLVHRDEVVPAERLIDELWSGRPPPTASKSLQVQVSQLRKDLASAAGANGGLLLTRAGGYVLAVGPESVDIARFERAVAEGQASLADGRPADAAARLRDALALWRGPALVDFAYESFAQDEIARLDELRIAALQDRIEADLELGRHQQLVAELESLIAVHPLREPLRAQLMLALRPCSPSSSPSAGSASRSASAARRPPTDPHGGAGRDPAGAGGRVVAATMQAWTSEPSASGRATGPSARTAPARRPSSPRTSGTARGGWAAPRTCPTSGRSWRRRRPWSPRPAS